ncbi:hypothetical protein [Lacticaseibacillus absianus]|uniref:hypothetical protein n=1 Tax=Lacticaseibacillus absianus TaxID=2729623 RepID=UPI0015CA7C96|nr:hypothetical protein [Lacticaseibacillus absianus]
MMTKRIWWTAGLLVLLAGLGAGCAWLLRQPLPNVWGVGLLGVVAGIDLALIIALWWTKR